MSGKSTEPKKIVVLGAHGMAGHVMVEYLDDRDDCNVSGIARETGRYSNTAANILDFETLRDHLENESPDVVINCVGVLVAESSRDVAKSILTNSYLPHFLSELGLKLGYRLVHISTDCVFSGKAGAYAEDAFRDGDDVYARTKALGEIDNDRDLTIRTSIVGPELKLNGTGLLDWFLKQSNEINGFAKAYWSGVTTLELAKATQAALKQRITGVLHLCPKDKISKYDLLELFNKVWQRQLTILPNYDHVVDKSLKSTRADFRYHDIRYEVMLMEMKQWMDERAAYYKHYEI